jgi:hypothetical protein
LVKVELVLLAVAVAHVELVTLEKDSQEETALTLAGAVVLAVLVVTVLVVLAVLVLPRQLMAPQLFTGRVAAVPITQ